MTANKDSERRKKFGEKLRARKKAPKGRGAGREEEDGQQLAQRLGAVAGRPRTSTAENSWPLPQLGTWHGHRPENLYLIQVMATGRATQVWCRLN